MRTLTTIHGLRSALVGVCLLLLLGSSYAGQTLARLSYSVPPDQTAEFVATYNGKIRPILSKHGWTESTERGRATPDSVFSRLFAFESTHHVQKAEQALSVDPSWRELQLELIETFGTTTSANRLVGGGLDVYRTAAGSGRQLAAGPGHRVDSGPGKGHWLSYDIKDGLGGGAIISMLQDREGNLWVSTQSGGVTRFDGLTFTTFTAEDGLADNWTGRITQDREAKLWVGTARGLSRYDGREWTAFNPENDLGSRALSPLIQDRAGNLWLSTSQGLNRYDGKTWETFTTDSGFEAGKINAILQDRGGTLWISTARGVGRYDGQAFKNFAKADGLASDSNQWIHEDRHGNLLLINRRGDVSRFDGEGFVGFPNKEVGMELVGGPIEDSKGDLWFSNLDKGVVRYDGSSFTSLSSQDGLTHDRVRTIFPDRGGHLWFGTEGGLSRYNGHHFSSFSTEDGLPDNRILVIFQDQEEHLWFGSRAGLTRYSGEAWTTLSVEDGLAGDNVRSVLQDREGHLWFAIDGVGISRYDGNSFTTFTVKDGLAYNGAWSMFQDREGYLWFGTRGGLSRYDGRTFTNFTSAHGLSNDEVWSISQDRKGNYWFGTEGGATLYDGEEFTNFTTADGLPIGRVLSIQEDRKGDFWFGTEVGAFRYDGEKFSRVTERSLENNLVRVIFEDRDGHLWFGTHRGIVKYDGRTFTPFSTEDGLGGNDVRSIFQGGEGHLWFCMAGGGVTRYDGQVFQTMTQGDGLASNHVRWGIEGLDRDFWFGTNRGVTRYRPPRKWPPRVLIDAVIADLRYEGTSDIAFSSDLELTAFEFSGMNFKTRPGAIVYRFRLNGFDEDWRTTRERRVEYQNLPRGNYTFEVEAIDRDLVYSENPAVIWLTVHLPFERIGLWSGLTVAIVLIGWQTARVVRRDRRLGKTNEALSSANNELFQVNVDLQREQVLERLRGQAQGMQSSEDIGSVAMSMFQEMKDLGIPISRSSVMLFHEDKGAYEYWFTTADGQFGEPVSQVMDAYLTNHPAYKAWKANERYLHVHRTREEIINAIRDSGFSGNPLPEVEGLSEEEWPDKMDFYWIFFRHGCLKLNLLEALSDDNLRIVERFADTFGFSYQRHEELKQKEEQNRRLAVEASVQRLRAEVQSMDEASDFERILSLLTDSLKTVELTFDSCEIDVLDEPVENPTMAHFEANGFRYTTFRMDPDGNVAPRSYNVTSPFQPVNEQTIERFSAGEPWQGLSDDLRIVEVPAGSYGRLRLTARGREQFPDDEVATLREFADAVALGYARYLDIREIQEQTERKSAFLASMSHELRTPMNAIKGFTNLVLRRGKDELSERNQENLQKVDQASDHLLGMINDLLDLSKIEAGRMDVAPERFNVRELVTSACDTVSPLIQEGVQLRQDVADDIGEANTDKVRLQQMVINLLSNAIKFTDSGSITVSAILSSNPDNGQRAPANGDLVIAVADTGKGIPQDEIATLFDEYRQVEGSESAVQKGTGLGLSITKKFAELLGGTISVESKIGKGSTFTLTMPADYPA